MCHINTKGKIANQGDVNSLITGLIFRQCVPFKENQIKDMAIYHSQGAQIKISEHELDSLIKTRLDTLERNDYISFRKGMYYPKMAVDHI